MQIFVRGLGWNTYTIDIEPEDTVVPNEDKVVVADEERRSGDLGADDDAGSGGGACRRQGGETRPKRRWLRCKGSDVDNMGTNA